MGEVEPFVVLPFLPPTSNNIYVSGRGGVRFLSKEAKNFKLKAIAFIQSTCMSKITKLDPGSLYRVWYVFKFPEEELINKTYGSGKKGAAQSRYKRMDVENRVKIVADSLATAIGIDDSQFFEGGHSKIVGEPQVQIFLIPAKPEYFGLKNE
jgi:Holliday junction resolvase RusA-like endonuclease